MENIGLRDLLGSVLFGPHMVNYLENKLCIIAVVSILDTEKGMVRPGKVCDA